MHNHGYHTLREVVSNVTQADQHPEALVNNMCHMVVPRQCGVENNAQVARLLFWTKSLATETYLDHGSAAEVLPAAKHHELGF